MTFFHLPPDAWQPSLHIIFNSWRSGYSKCSWSEYWVSPRFLYWYIVFPPHQLPRKGENQLHFLRVTKVTISNAREIKSPASETAFLMPTVRPVRSARTLLEGNVDIRFATLFSTPEFVYRLVQG
jgi:hypothetical protein